MQLLIRHATYATADIWDRVIMAATGGTAVHAEVRFYDGRCSGAVVPGGVRYLDQIDTGDSLSWQVIDLPWEETGEIADWCACCEGQPYDYVGAIACGLGLATQQSGRWFCSEWAAAVMARASGIPFPVAPCPVQLREFTLSLLSRIRGREDVALGQLEERTERYYATRRRILEERLSSPHAAQATEEEAAVRGWQHRIMAGRDQKEIAAEIERWHQQAIGA